jgi:hypothetical protein
MKTWQWLSIVASAGISGILEFGFSSEAEHHGFVWESIPLFYIIFGFIGCIIMIIVPKFIGKLLLQKDESYYNVG